MRVSLRILIPKILSEDLAHKDLVGHNLGQEVLNLVHRQGSIEEKMAKADFRSLGNQVNSLVRDNKVNFQGKDLALRQRAGLVKVDSRDNSKVLEDSKEDLVDKDLGDPKVLEDNNKDFLVNKVDSVDRADARVRKNDLIYARKIPKHVSAHL